MICVLQIIGHLIQCADVTHTKEFVLIWSVWSRCVSTLSPHSTRRPSIPQHLSLLRCLETTKQNIFSVLCMNNNAPPLMLLSLQEVNELMETPSHNAVVG